MLVWWTFVSLCYGYNFFSFISYFVIFILISLAYQFCLSCQKIGLIFMCFLLIFLSPFYLFPLWSLLFPYSHWLWALFFPFFFLIFYMVDYIVSMGYFMFLEIGLFTINFPLKTSTVPLDFVFVFICLKVFSNFLFDFFIYLLRT